MILGRSTSGLMVLVVAVAAFLAFVRDPARALLWAVLAAFLLIFASWAWFEFLPLRLVDRLVRDEGRRRRLLELIASTPNMLGERGKVRARYKLFEHHRAAGRLEEAVTSGRALLGSGAPAAFRGMIRGRLADCLDRLGRPGEAAEERRRLEAEFDADFASQSEWIARAGRFRAQGRHAEALEAYDRALELVPDGEGPARAVALLLEMVAASYNAGRPAEAIRHAEAAIDRGASGRSLVAAHRLAGQACVALGRLDAGEDQARRALELAESGGDDAAVAESLLRLAAIGWRRGRSGEAERLCGEAEAIAPGLDLAHAIRADILTSQGRFEEALERTARPPSKPPKPREAAARALNLAAIAANLGRWPEAEAHLREADGAQVSDPRLGLLHEAASARVDAGLGRLDEARARLDRAEARLAEVAADRGIRLTILGTMGRAALLLGDFGRAEGFWTASIALEPDPVHRPFGLYHLGEALLGLGRVDDARDAFRLAVDPGIDTHHARLARARLDPGDAGPARPIP